MELDILELVNTPIYPNQTKKFIIVIQFGERCLKDVIQPILGLIDKKHKKIVMYVKNGIIFRILRIGI